MDRVPCSTVHDPVATLERYEVGLGPRAIGSCHQQNRPLGVRVHVPARFVTIHGHLAVHAKIPNGASLQRGIQKGSRNEQNAECH